MSLLSGRRVVHAIEDIGHLAEDPLVPSSVAGRRRDIGMSEKVGDDFEVYAGRNESRGEGVAEVVDCELGEVGIGGLSPAYGAREPSASGLGSPLV